MLENASMSKNVGKCDYYDLTLHISFFMLHTDLEDVKGVKIDKNTIFMS